MDEIEKVKVLWSDIKNHALDVYLYQLRDEVSIASIVGGQMVEELVGKAKNFAIVLLDSEIVGGQPDKIALTQKPTPKKRVPRKKSVSEATATP